MTASAPEVRGEVPGEVVVDDRLATVLATVPASHAGARIVIVNNQPTPMDGLADVLLRAPIGDVLPVLCGG